jgi:hypothetical protein
MVQAVKVLAAMLATGVSRLRPGLVKTPQGVFRNPPHGADGIASGLVGELF